MLRIYVESDLSPWKTWPHDLWYGSNGGTEIVSDKSIANVCVFEYYDGIDIEEGTPFWLFIESEDCCDTDNVAKVFYNNESCHGVLTESSILRKSLEDKDVYCSIWYRPIGVSDGLSKIPIVKKDITMVLNAHKNQYLIKQAVKTLIGMMAEDENGVSDFDGNINIFSAQDLQFGTFNNIIFHGLKPTNVVSSAVKNSLATVFPYCGDGFPIWAINSMALGTIPVILKNFGNQLNFWWIDSFYNGDEDLGLLIKKIKTMSVSEYGNVALTNYTKATETFSAKHSVDYLSSIVGRFVK